MSGLPRYSDKLIQNPEVDEQRPVATINASADGSGQLWSGMGLKMSKGLGGIVSEQGGRVPGEREREHRDHKECKHECEAPVLRARAEIAH